VLEGFAANVPVLTSTTSSLPEVAGDAAVLVDPEDPGVIAAGLWAATTVLVRATNLSRATATKTLLYQLGVSALILPLASIAMGERGVISLTPLALASLAYQGVIVAFASYLAWFWLLTRYLAARLAVFSFLSPLFGVLAGVIVLGEPLRPWFAAAAALVVAGIVLVNLRQR